MKIKRPTNILTGKSTFKHIHSEEKPRDTKKCFNQYRETKNFPDEETGMNTVSYEIRRMTLMFVKTIPYLQLDVALECHYEKTPWCDCRPLIRMGPGDAIVPLNQKI